MSKVYMFSHVSGLTTCPLSMTDGAAFLIEYISKHSPKLVTSTMKNAYLRLISIEPEKFFTSGQWMTEILGGSDVRKATQTKAVYNPLNNNYLLYGLKWFTSAIDSDITFTLAKIYDPSTKKLDGKPSLFFVKLRDSDGKLNSIEIQRLKDKLGTKQLPTAELILKGTISEIASPREQGIPYIMQLANITRMHNMCNSVGYMRGIISLIDDFSQKREVFGKLLKDQPLYISTLNYLKMLLEGNLLLCLYASKLMGDNYIRPNNQIIELLRVILPLGKIICSKHAEEVCLEGIQSIGANGYMENSGIPHFLRDTLSTSIWEGTQNTLTMEIIKNFEKLETQNLFINLISENIKDYSPMGTNKELIEDFLRKLKVSQKDISFASKDFCFFMASFLILSLVILYSPSKHILIDFWFLKTSFCLQQAQLLEVINKFIFV